MAHVNLISVLALSITGATSLLVACGSNGGNTGDEGTSPPLGAVGTGGVVYGAGGGTAVTTAPPVSTTPTGTTGVTNPPPSTGTGGTTQVVTQPPPPSGGTTGVITTGAAGAAAGGAPAGGATGAAGSTGTSTGTWDPNANLDANGKLIAPTADQGFQLVTPTFALQPGQEVFNCYHVATPNTATFPVGEWDSQMSPGSHHFILYRADTDASATAQGVLTQGGCTQGFGGTTWLYTMGAPRGHLQFPDAVAMELTPNEHIDFDMHYINTTSEAIQAHIALNVNKVKTMPYQKADAEISFNVGIDVPPMGTQTVQGTCPNVPGANYFLLSTHMHHHGTDATISVARQSGMTELLVHTTNWDSPDAKVYQQAPFLTLSGSDHFIYTCSYKNDTNVAVLVGTSAATNEMCMMETYFFPATGTAPRCN